MRHLRQAEVAARRCRRCDQAEGEDEATVLTDVGLFSHTVAALGFGALAVVLLTRRAQSGTSLWLIAASLVTMVWALVVVLAEQNGGRWLLVTSPAETLRSAAWIAFLLALLRRCWRP